jgi:hypothetical protein
MTANAAERIIEAKDAVFMTFPNEVTVKICIQPDLHGLNVLNVDAMYQRLP